MINNKSGLCPPAPKSAVHYIGLIVILLALLCFQNFSFGGDKVAEIDKLLAATHKNGLLNGVVLVAEKGKIIYKKAFGLANAEWNVPHDLDSKFPIYSMSKQFTAALALQLVQEGKLKTDGKISDYLPWYRKDTGGKVTLHHLMTHTHGIPGLDYPNLPLEHKMNTQQFIKTFQSGDLEFEPGSQFKYGSGFNIVAAIVEEVTGKSYETLLKEKIFKPLGMKNTGVRHTAAVVQKMAASYRDELSVKRDPFYDYPCNGGSALYSCLGDLYLWDRALYTDKILSKKYRDLMTAHHVKARTGFYAYGWDITLRKVGETEKKFVWHGGGGSTMLYRSVDDQNLVIILNNKTATHHYRTSIAVMDILNGQPYRIPKPSVVPPLLPAVDAGDMKAVAELYWKLRKSHPGKYEFGENELNSLGYWLVGQKKIDYAIEIFKLNVEAFPKAWNVYDSLGEAYIKAGKKELAIVNYKKAMKLNPRKTDREKESYKAQQKAVSDLKD